ncbi:hypothetical protein G6F46_005905 [Rhizopus delemar]|nr:hypothetical protein G6F43_001894 [Rhizopus delemar]KAG1544573.1 hypothetical protein G6F51_005977 [Rhizopus arrhizus]KAG1460035.1 hypothetical protein G6F55_004408 [Rhizopus delemar]KAG1498300.1 hypothetical protein G6F54_005176 [Rhizopus delemar]KAG1512036.1 hypothetical protein G6F53_005490 [Rhizopus delemar]
MDKVVTPTQMISLSTVARRRMRTSKEEMAVLDEYYRKNPNPNQEEKKEIANLLKMGTKNVHFWFQNRRAKENKKKKVFQQQLKQKKSQQTSIPSSSKQKQHYLRSTTNTNTSSKQQQEDSDTQPLQLPPISDIMVCPAQNLSIPFFFYHSKFGIEDSLV